jgi:pteridine reductase
MELTGKTAIVTGASGALGGEIAVGLAKAGCDVVVHYYRNAQRAGEIVAQVQAAGRKALAIQADLCAPTLADMLRPHEKTVTRWKDLLEKDGMGPVRILVNSAALFGRTPVGSTDRASASRIVELDLLAPILLSQAFACFINEAASGQRTADSGQQDEVRGKIINIVDVGGERAWKEYSVYCAAKAGLIAATKSLAKELAPAITVNAVAPGVVTWPEGIDEAGKKRQLGFIPAGRIAQPQEIAAAVVFLLQNDYITGQVINVDGGRSV